MLPLVEMFCKWELGEDCGDLRALMLRFDSELELATHDLGRSLLCMLRDDNEDFDRLPLHTEVPVRTNPFADVTERLQAAGIAIRELHAQVHHFSVSLFAFLLLSCRVLSITVAITVFFP